MGAVAESLEKLAERVADPGALVYARLFERHPETEALFLMDKGGHVRGQMLAVAFEALLDGGRRLAGLLDIERMNHVNIGVPQPVFDGFLPLVMETVRDVLGEDWTEEMEEGWTRCLADLGPVSASDPARRSCGAGQGGGTSKPGGSPSGG